MRPWQHARSTARPQGRLWQEDLPIHEFIDITKASLPDLRHRMVLHNCDLGPALAALAFPSVPHARQVARTHARQDLGSDVPLSWWRDHCRPEALPRERTLDLEALIERERRRAKLKHADGPRRVAELLELPERFAPGSRAFLAHAGGLAILRRVLGPPSEEAGEGGRTVIFDALACAEAMIIARFRRIPQLRELACALRADYNLELEARAERGQIRHERLATE